MRPDALELLTMIASFLDRQVADQVPSALRSDVRAAAKNLIDVREQLDAAFPLLSRECEELFAALGRAAPGHPQRGMAQSLTELQAEHTRLLQELGDRVLVLQAQDDPASRAMLAGVFALLREQAGRRLDWQSVFPADRLVSDVLRQSWPIITDDEESASGQAG